MRPAAFFADGIDLPLVAFYGIAVLVPLMLFQVAVEGGILSRTWGIAFKQLARPVFRANCWSLLAGIPTKIINAGVYSYLLPGDLSSYFARYPFAVMVGTLVFFVVTILVEGFSLSRWLKRECRSPSRGSFWLGVLLANTATYSVLAPIHYLATRPIHDVREFASDTRWASQPPTQIICIDSKTQYLKSIYSDGTKPTTLVRTPVTDYLVTSNMDLILVSCSNGPRHLYRMKTDVMEEANATNIEALAAQATFGPRDKEDWGGEDSFGNWNAWVEPGLGNHVRLYRANDKKSSVINIGVNPGLLHLSEFQFTFSHPAFISGGRECLFQSGSAIYLLDIEQRRVGKLADGHKFILLTPAYAKSP